MVGSIGVVQPHHHPHEGHQDEEAGEPSTGFCSHTSASLPIHRPIPSRLLFWAENAMITVVVMYLPLILSNLHIYTNYRQLSYLIHDDPKDEQSEMRLARMAMLHTSMIDADRSQGDDR